MMKSKAGVALLTYTIVFGLASFLYIRGFQKGALVLVIVVWASLALWLQKGGR